LLAPECKELGRRTTNSGQRDIELGSMSEAKSFVVGATTAAVISGLQIAALFLSKVIAALKRSSG